MKRICSLLLAIMLGVLCVSAAAAETGAVSMKELPEMTSPVWKQTYEAYGRTIDVDVKVTIPEAETAPVLKVRWVSPLEDPLKSRLAEEYKKADRNDKKHYYDFDTSDYETIRLEHKTPVLWGTSKKKDNLEGVTTTCQDMIGYDEDRAYAENNPMTVRQAAEILRSHLKEVLPDVEVTTDTVILYGKTFWRRNKKTVYDKGFYTLNMRQCFHGIPYMASIYEAYIDDQDDIWDWRDDEKWIQRGLNRFHGTMFGEVFGEDSWMIVGRFYQETGRVCEDIPVLPFDQVKGEVERLIAEGYIRWINSVTLGYVHFETEDPKEFILLPCWVVWCEYHRGGPQSEKTYGINDSELMFDGNSEYYRPVVINAQTGKLFDPASLETGRIMCPDLSAWQ